MPAGFGYGGGGGGTSDCAARACFASTCAGGCFTFLGACAFAAMTNATNASRRQGKKGNECMNLGHAATEATSWLQRVA